MTSTLVDSNVLIDIATDDPVWSSWSAESLRRASLDGELVINSIIYGEISGAFEMIEEVDAFLDGKLYRREDVPWAAAFLASRAFRVYRRRGGGKVSPLPDFYIGWACGPTRIPAAHARSRPLQELLSGSADPVAGGILND